MHASEVVNGWLQEIGQQEGVSMQLEDTGICSLDYDDDLECNIELDDRGDFLYLHSPLVPCPAENRLPLFERLLKMNAYSMQTEGGNLGYCDGTDLIVFSRRYRVEDLDALALQQALNDFAVAAGHLRDELLQTQQPPTDQFRGDVAQGDTDDADTDLGDSDQFLRV